jgi:DNA-binding transcriptional LysR family regulator
VIATERAIVLLPDGDALAREADVALADLDGRGLIVFQNALSVGLNARIAEIAAGAAVSLRIVQEVSQLPSMAYHVAHDDGIAILPLSSGGFPYPGVAIRPIRDPAATIDLTVVTRRGEEAPHVRRFLRLLDVRFDETIV